MSDATTSQGRQSTPVPRLRGAATFGFLVALLILIFVVLVAPDDGLDAGSLPQGIAIASVIVAVPVATIVRSVDASRVVSLGGAMAVAGIATMFGGNLAGLLMAISGVAIFLVGASREPPISWGPRYQAYWLRRLDHPGNAAFIGGCDPPDEVGRDVVRWDRCYQFSVG